MPKTWKEGIDLFTLMTESSFFCIHIKTETQHLTFRIRYSVRLHDSVLNFFTLEVTSGELDTGALISLPSQVVGHLKNRSRVVVMTVTFNWFVFMAKVKLSLSFF